MLEATRPNNREILRLIEEIEEGSSFLNVPSEDEVRARLGMQKTSNSSAAPKKISVRRVGERAPKRDKVKV